MVYKKDDNLSITKTGIENFPKHWVSIVKTQNGYGVPDYGKNPVSLEIFGNVIIHNIFGCTGTYWTKDFVKTGPNTYRITPPFASNNDSLDIFTIKIIDPVHYIASLSTKFMDCDFIAKNYRLLLIPADSIVNYPILHYPPHFSGNKESHITISNRAKNSTISKDKIITQVIYKSKLDESFLDSIRQKEDKRQLKTEALFFPKWKLPYTQEDLKRNKDFQAFNKEWVCVHKKGTGYVLYWKHFNSNIQITENKIIINTPEKTYTHFIKSFQKKSSGAYIETTSFPKNDSLNIFIFKPMDKETGMIEAQFNLPTPNGLKVYSWKMAPLRDMLKFLLVD